MIFSNDNRQRHKQNASETDFQKLGSLTDYLPSRFPTMIFAMKNDEFSCAIRSEFSSIIDVCGSVYDI